MSHPRKRKWPPNELESLVHGVVYEDLELVAACLAAGQDVNARINDDGDTPILAACDVGNAEIVKLLLAHGADPNLPNDVGMYPLHYAAMGDSVDVLALMQASGTQQHVKDAEGKTPLDWARFYERSECEQFLRSWAKSEEREV